MAVTAYPFLHTRRSVRKGFKKAIASYIQASHYTGQANFVFRILGLEAKNCTVGDCIRIMMVDSREEQAWAIARELKKMQYWKELLDGCQANMEEESAWVKEEYRQQIDKSQQRINLLRESDSEEIIRYYESWNQQQILAVYAVCRYEICLPGNNSSEVRTETFILAPDGETVIGKEPYGKLSLAKRKVN